MALTEKEKDAIRTLAEHYLACNNECKTCELHRMYRLCIVEVAYLDQEKMKL